MSTITVEEALENLQGMFPSFEKDTLATLLQSNNNNISTTIELILSMESGESVASATTNVSGNNEVDQSLENEVERIIQEHNNENVHPKENLPVDQTPQPSKMSRKIPKDALYRGTKTALPDDFLRLSSFRSNNAASTDEQLALMLQNELYQKDMLAQQQAARVRSANSRSQPTPEGIPDMGILKGLSSAAESSKNFFNSLMSQPNSNTSMEMSNAQSNTSPFHSSGGTSSMTSMTPPNADAASGYKPVNSRLQSSEDDDEIISFGDKHALEEVSLEDDPPTRRPKDHSTKVMNSNF